MILRMSALITSGEGIRSPLRCLERAEGLMQTERESSRRLSPDEEHTSRSASASFRRSGARRPSRGRQGRPRSSLLLAELGLGLGRCVRSGSLSRGAQLRRRSPCSESLPSAVPLRQYQLWLHGKRAPAPMYQVKELGDQGGDHPIAWHG